MIYDDCLEKIKYINALSTKHSISVLYPCAGALSRPPPVISNHLSAMLFAIIIKSKEIATYSVSIFLHYMFGMAGNKIMQENDRCVY